MKELTIQEKAKRYNKSLTRASNLHKNAVEMENNMVAKTCEIIFPELKESEDEKIKRIISDILLIDNDDIREILESNNVLMQDIDDWLEKQGQNKLIDEVEPKFHEGDKIKLAKEPKYPEREIIAIKNGAYYFDKLVHLPFSRQDEWELVEQKPADEVEPKFKVDDWIVYNRNDSSREILYVYDIRDGRYYFNDNIHFSWSVKECDEKCHLWTIDDVKDGDVVAKEPYGTYEKPFVAIYKQRGLDHFVSYCFTSFDGKFNEGTSGHYLNVHPATKEQCEQLEKAMTEAGWEFDFDKKELKKIEQKPAWSEEDEDMLQSILDEYKSMATEKRNWLKSIKDIVQPQTKQEWSEEDENRFKNLIYLVEHSDEGKGTKEGFIKFINRLKSLKSKNAWKPSKEQMGALANACDGHILNLDYLNSLYQDLKKLKG